MPSVLLVRHGQASFGAADYDVLSDTGHAQAATVADELVARGVRVGRLVSGGLARQLDTAAPIAARLAREVEIDPRWDEYLADDILEHHSGSAARQARPPGSPAPEISSRAFQSILEDALLHWITAGEGGPAREPWPAFAARVEDALRDVAASLGKGETAVVCTSGGVIAAACVALLRIPAPTFVALNRVSVNASLTLVAHGRGGTTLVSYNEHGHLDRGGRSLVTYR